MGEPVRKGIRHLPFVGNWCWQCLP
jgi:hypothetical protein